MYYFGEKCLSSTPSRQKPESVTWLVAGGGGGGGKNRSNLPNCDMRKTSPPSHFDRATNGS